MRLNHRPLVTFGLAIIGGQIVGMMGLPLWVAFVVGMGAFAVSVALAELT